MTEVAVPPDPLTLKLSGADQEAFARVLAQAFPDPAYLNLMLQARLELSLAAIAAPYPYDLATFAVVGYFKARGHLLRLLAAARAAQPDNPQLSAFAEGFGLAVRTPPRTELEAIVKKTSVPFDAEVWRQRCARRERCVCRLDVPTNDGLRHGSGFLVGPDLVLTNYHVMSPAIAGLQGAYDENGLTASAADVTVLFDHRLLSDGTTIHPGVAVRLAADWLVDYASHSPIDFEGRPKQGTPASDQLDYALIRLEEPVGSMPIPVGKGTEPMATQRGWMELPQKTWPFKEQSALFIIQHPQGGPMKLALDLEAKMEVNANGTRVTYQTGTEPGSSGSPCFNQYWEIVALHHAGDPAYSAFHHAEFNEGIPIHAVVARLKAQGATAGMTLV